MTSTITTVDCGGARIRAHCRHLATVVTIQGEIDAVNVERLAQYLRRFLLDESPVVLDMSDVSGFTVAGLSLLLTFDDDCATAGLEWTLVPGRAVTELLSDAAAEETFPVARSVHEALRNLADAIVSRRQLVLPLIKKTA
ncbi:MAG: STAS domain-containing protein [Mycobacterium sp.]|nr:STAS domain-containing protein [Mycobacterium sp.]HKI43027.1 STAS domain-containing protein [Mycobacterium sp.]